MSVIINKRWPSCFQQPAILPLTSELMGTGLCVRALTIGIMLARYAPQEQFLMEGEDPLAGRWGNIFRSNPLKNLHAVFSLTL